MGALLLMSIIVITFNNCSSWTTQCVLSSATILHPLQVTCHKTVKFSGQRAKTHWLLSCVLVITLWSSSTAREGDSTGICYIFLICWRYGGFICLKAPSRRRCHVIACLVAFFRILGLRILSDCCDLKKQRLQDLEQATPTVASTQRHIPSGQLKINLF